MANLLNTIVYDKGLEHFKNNCDKIMLLNGAGDINNYATTVALGCADVTVTASHFTLAANGTARKLTRPLIEGTATATVDASADKKVAYLDTANSVVLSIADETTDQAITSGNPIDFSAGEIGFTAPV